VTTPDDVASEAWLQIARDIRTFRDHGRASAAGQPGSPATGALDHLRHHRRRPVTIVPADPPGGGAPTSAPSGAPTSPRR